MEAFIYKAYSSIILFNYFCINAFFMQVGFPQPVLWRMWKSVDNSALIFKVFFIFGLKIPKLSTVLYVDIVDNSLSQKYPFSVFCLKILHFKRIGSNF